MTDELMARIRESEYLEHKLSQATEIIEELLDEVSACDPYSYHNDKASPIRQRAREFVENNK